MNWLINLFGIDKLKHVGVCFLISACIGILLLLLSSNFLIATIAAIYCGLVAAVTKEWSDEVNQNNRWDWYDIIADAVGIIFAILWLIMFHFSKG